MPNSLPLPNSFSKSQRITRGDDFTRILHNGQYAADGTLVVFVIASDRDSPRLGVTIPKKAGNAVVRNQWKRWIRESFRTQQDLIPAGFDYIVRPKKGAKPSWQEIQKSMPRLAKKAVARGQ
ncbi:MAG: ribonuclease P protein component [Rubripirellula sp.]